jgi:hypothetical protein
MRGEMQGLFFAVPEPLRHRAHTRGQVLHCNIREANLLRWLAHFALNLPVRSIM